MECCHLRQHDGSRDYDAKQSQSDGEGQEPCDCTHMWDIRKQKATNEPTKQTELTDTDPSGYQRGGGGTKRVRGRPDFRR